MQAAAVSSISAKALQSSVERLPANSVIGPRICCAAQTGRNTLPIEIPTAKAHDLSGLSHGRAGALFAAFSSIKGPISWPVQRSTWRGFRP